MIWIGASLLDVWMIQPSYLAISSWLTRVLYPCDSRDVARGIVVYVPFGTLYFYFTAKSIKGSFEGIPSYRGYDTEANRQPTLFGDAGQMPPENTPNSIIDEYIDWLWCGCSQKKQPSKVDLEFLVIYMHQRDPLTLKRTLYNFQIRSGFDTSLIQLGTSICLKSHVSQPLKWDSMRLGYVVGQTNTP